MKYEITKEQILQLDKSAINDTPQLVTADLKNWFPDAFKKELKIGQWVKYVRDKNGLPVVYVLDLEQGFGYGVNYDGDWQVCDESTKTDTTWSFITEASLWQPATTQEVKSALSNELVKRGFVNGVKFKGVAGIESYKTITIGDRCEVKFNDVGIFCGNSYIMLRGKWATIIEQPQIKEVTLAEIKEKFGCEIKIVESKSN